MFWSKGTWGLAQTSSGRGWPTVLECDWHMDGASPGLSPDAQRLGNRRVLGNASGSSVLSCLTLSFPSGGFDLRISRGCPIHGGSSTGQKTWAWGHCTNFSSWLCDLGLVPESLWAAFLGSQGTCKDNLSYSKYTVVWPQGLFKKQLLQDPRAPSGSLFRTLPHTPWPPGLHVTWDLPREIIVFPAFCSFRPWFPQHDPDTSQLPLGSVWLTHCQHLSPLVPAPAQIPLLGFCGDPRQGLFLPSGGGDCSWLFLDSFPLSLIPKAKRSQKNDSLLALLGSRGFPQPHSILPSCLLSCQQEGLDGTAGCWPSAGLGKTLSFPPSPSSSPSFSLLSLFPLYFYLFLSLYCLLCLYRSNKSILSSKYQVESAFNTPNLLNIIAEPWTCSEIKLAYN